MCPHVVKDVCITTLYSIVYIYIMIYCIIRVRTLALTLLYLGGKNSDQNSRPEQNAACGGLRPASNLKKGCCSLGTVAVWIQLRMGHSDKMGIVAVKTQMSKKGSD